MEPVSLPALPGLLDGWSGPIEVYVGPDVGWIPATVLDGRAVFALHADIPKRLPLDRAEVRDRVIRWAADGERCRNCGGVQPESCALGCRSGWTRRPFDLSWQRDRWDIEHARRNPTAERRWIVTPSQSAALLRCSALRVVGGMEPVRGVLGEWADDRCGVWRRHGIAGRLGWATCHIRPVRGDSQMVGVQGWYTADDVGVAKWSGPETGADGQRLADAAALAAGFALVDGDSLTLPEVPDVP